MRVQFDISGSKFDTVVAEMQLWLEGEAVGFYSTPSGFRMVTPLEATWLPEVIQEKMARLDGKLGCGARTVDEWDLYLGCAGNWVALNASQKVVRFGGRRHGLLGFMTGFEGAPFFYPEGGTAAPELKPWETAPTPAAAERYKRAGKAQAIAALEQPLQVAIVTLAKPGLSKTTLARKRQWLERQLAPSQHWLLG